ncbi:MAG: asparagine synthase (glutamine-hydrolyzing) [Acidimicrobiaceae bacterium]|nr:asparagine synthase (glutamine-hydrolyzing) [Acidimicrobiaceae bacterium]
MCGIAGLLDRRSGRTVEELEAVAGRMADRLVHRGPDDRGTWCEPASGVAFGHRRLSIVDLSAAGHQPMTSADGRWVIAYNGELYNADELRATLGERRRSALRGHSDTEVLLEAVAERGVEWALARAVGMFAFALWDRRNRELWLARDRFGEKPLYYGWSSEGLLFGSELKALHAVDGFAPDVDADSVVDLLRWSCVPAPWTIYEGVRKVRPGHVLRFDASARLVDEVAYWSPAEVAAATSVQPVRGEEAVDELEELLGRVVASRMVADVPLGAFLSGGIDSSTVVALMSAVSGDPVKTFTIGFPDPAFDESAHAAAVAGHLGSDHHSMEVSPTEAREVIPLLPAMYDEPFADSSQIPTHLVSRLARRHVTVSLSGDGGDELFGGYDRYRHLARLSKLHGTVPAPIRRIAARSLACVTQGTWDRIGTSALMLPAPPVVRHRLGHRVHKVARVLAARSSGDLYEAMMSAENEAADIVPKAVGRSGGLYELDGAEMDGFRAAMLMDTMVYLPDDLLVKTDRASMGVSLEARMPLLDPELFSFAWSLAPEDRVRGGSGKWALRRLLHRYVPAEMVERPKMGFGIPLGSWLRGPLRGWADELLAPDLLAAQGIFDPALVAARWAEHVENRGDLSFQLWPILMFQSWWHEGDGR